MITLNDSIYKNLARLLTARIGDGEFFNGTIRMQSEQCDLTFRSTLLVYRSAMLDPAMDTTTYRNPGDVSTTLITNIVPVWWECATIDDRGPVTNDFCWKQLLEYALGDVAVE